MNNFPKNVLNKIHSAEIVKRDFVNPETNQKVEFSVLELGLYINDELVKLPFNLSKKSNAELLILASKEQNGNFLDDIKGETDM